MWPGSWLGRGLISSAEYRERLQEMLTSASICCPTALWLWRCLQRMQPSTIAEFGTGRSMSMMRSLGIVPDTDGLAGLKKVGT
jgi:hypothetical protein